MLPFFKKNKALFNNTPYRWPLLGHGHGHRIISKQIKPMGGEKNLPNTKLWEVLVLVLIQGCINKARATLQI